jgi:hypothetical protein
LEPGLALVPGLALALGSELQLWLEQENPLDAQARSSNA